MVRHNLLLAYRHLKKHKASFFINLIGLSTGLACAILIFLWVSDELGVDKFHNKDARLYQLMQNFSTPAGIETKEHTPGSLAAALAKELPEVELAATVVPSSWFRSKGFLSVGNQAIKASEQYVSADFFRMFSYKLLQGDKSNPLPAKNAVLISEEMGNKLFQGTENSLGKSIAWNREEYSGEFYVSGVFATPPQNASDQFDLLFPYELFLDMRPNTQSWQNSDPSTYVLLKEGNDLAQFNFKIADLIKEKSGDEHRSLFARPYSDKYLYGQYENGVQAGGRIAYVQLFSIIAIFILLIACINFMNLATAKAAGRMKEVGIKKTLGVKRKALVFQFLAESVLMAFFSLLLSLLFVFLLLPQFNALSGKSLALSFNAQLLFSVSGITLLTGLLSGSYPAFYLSGFNPLSVLKGNAPAAQGKGGVVELWLRKGLVVFQFADLLPIP